MDFKDLASKLIDDISGIQTKVENEQIKTIKEDLELDLDLNFNENDSDTDFDLDIEDEIEQIKLETPNEQLFDGYLGEKNFDPNPLECGPNAMYRKNGVVYRKSVDNLWEVYLKDGSPGPRGAAGGSGVGVQEAKQIATEIVNNATQNLNLNFTTEFLDDYGLLVVGDSITNQESRTSLNEYNSGFNNYQAHGAVNWMQSILKDQSFQRVYFRGKSGLQAVELYTSARAGWTLDNIISGCNAKHVLIGIGTNDVGAPGVTVESCVSALSGIAEYFKTKNRIVHIKSIYPRRVADATWTSAIQIKQLKINKFIQDICIKNGYQYVPVSEALTDWLQTSAYICSANGIRSTYDAIHINNYGAMVQGYVLADHFKNVNNNIYTSPCHYIDDSTFDSSITNLVKNPLFATASGPSTSGWTTPTTYGGGTVTMSLIRSPDNIGYAIQFDVSGVSSAPSSTQTLLYQTFNLTSATRILGNNLVGSMRVKISSILDPNAAPTGVFYPWIHASVTNNGTKGWGAIAGLYGDSGNNSPIDRPIDLLIRTPPLNFTGIETSTSNLLRIGCMCTVGASFRMIVFSPTIKLNADPYNSKKNWMFTDTQPPEIAYL